MKRTIYFLMAALLLSFASIVAQTKVDEQKTDVKKEVADTVFTKDQMIKKYETDIIKLQQSIEKRIYELALNDPIARDRLSKLAEADGVYNQLFALIAKLNEYIKRENKK